MTMFILWLWRFCNYPRVAADRTGVVSLKVLTDEVYSSYWSAYFFQKLVSVIITVDFGEATQLIIFTYSLTHTIGWMILNTFDRKTPRVHILKLKDLKCLVRFNEIMRHESVKNIHAARSWMVTSCRIKFTAKLVLHREYAVIFFIYYLLFEKN